MIRRFAFVLALITMTAAIAAPGIASAQTEPEQPAPPPPPPPPADVPHAAAPLGPSDHQEVIGAVGLEISRSISVIQPTDVTPVGGVTNVGIRYWFNEKMGVDAGLGLSIAHTSDGNSATGIGFGLNAGVPIALGIYRHITTFFEPSMDFFLIKVNTDVDTFFSFDLLGSLGFEWQLGWVEASRIALLLRLGAGINLNSDGATTRVSFATGGGSSVEGLFNTTLALAFYL